MDAVVRALGAITWVTGVERVDGYLRVAAPTARAAELNGVLAAQGILLSELGPFEMDLESVFLELTDEESPS